MARTKAYLLALFLSSGCVTQQFTEQWDDPPAAPTPPRRSYLKTYRVAVDDDGDQLRCLLTLGDGPWRSVVVGDRDWFQLNPEAPSLRVEVVDRRRGVRRGELKPPDGERDLSEGPARLEIAESADGERIELRVIRAPGRRPYGRERSGKQASWSAALPTGVEKGEGLKSAGSKTLRRAVIVAALPLALALDSVIGVGLVLSRPFW